MDDYYLMWVPASGIGQTDRPLENKIKELLGITGLDELLSKQWVIRPGRIYLLTQQGYQEILVSAKQQGKSELVDQLEKRKHCWFPANDLDA